METVILIYRNVEVGGRTFRCSNCKNHILLGVCPRFCPICGVEYALWLDASIDKSYEPDRRWVEGEIEPVPMQTFEDSGCGLANPPKIEEKGH